MRTPFVAGNWKMFKTTAESRSFLKGLRAHEASFAGCDVVVCPPFTALAAAAEALANSPIRLGAQNVHWEKQGAYTGEISAGMLSELGARFVIVGHSERRQYFGETDATVQKRMLAALNGGLTPIVCVGELLAEREAGKTLAVLERQMRDGLKGLADPASIVIAYEPVWAIGTGKVATPDQAQEAHAFIRKLYGQLYTTAAAQAVRILYGGSVKPDNITGLMKQPDIDGGLVGGACLEAESFSAIVKGAIA